MVKKEPMQKKRGRKPKGGKIVNANEIQQSTIQTVKPNVILHLQCFLSDLEIETQKDNDVKAYNEPCNTLQFSTVNTVDEQVVEDKPAVVNNTTQPTPNEAKELYERLNELNKHMRHIQKNSDDIHNVVSHETIEKMEKRSACFWCTCEFETPSIYLPKHEVNGRYEVYGCFCSPECACAYLFDESIDQSLKWERYALLNYLYKNVFYQTKSFHPAPDPRFLLNKYFGILTIEEYRALLRTGKHIMVIDKPISKVYPEVHVDNHEFEDFSGVRGKRKMRLTAPKHVKQKKMESKNSIVQNIFGVSTG